MDNSRTAPVWPTGLKRTRQREAVLAALTEADAPVTAMQLASLLEQRGDAMWLSTIYRVLDIFTAHKLVTKIQVLDSGIHIYELSREHHCHYAVCVLCNRVISMENCPMEHFSPRLSEQDFHVVGHKLQIYGYCADCARRIEVGEGHL